MIRGRLLLLLLLFSLLPFLADGTAKGKRGGKRTIAEKKDYDDDEEPEKSERMGDCIPPPVVVIFFTLYGLFLIGLYIKGARQCIGLLQAKNKLRKMMALELSIIHYDDYCERRALRGRTELFTPASNDGFFMDADVQEAWLSVNNLRQRVVKVPTHDFQAIIRKNWDTRKLQQLRKTKRLREAASKAKQTPTHDSLLRMDLQNMRMHLLRRELWVKTEKEKQAEAEAENAKEPTQTIGNDNDKKEDASRRDGSEAKKKEESDKKEKDEEKKGDKDKEKGSDGTDKKEAKAEKKESESDEAKKSKKEKEEEKKEEEKKKEEEATPKDTPPAADAKEKKKE